MGSHGERCVRRTNIGTTVASQTQLSPCLPGVALPALALRWLPTAAGLGAIPFIVTPIDEFVDFALDNSTRKLLCSHD